MKDYLNRLIEDRLRELFDYFPVVSLLGARQVGKSTLVRNVFGDRLKTIVFDPVKDVGQARSDPDLFLDNNPPPLFLDEVQYAPELLAALKRRVDLCGTAGQYVLSGSQNLSVVKNISESLAGRVGILQLGPMAFSELTSQVDLPGFLEGWLAGDVQSVVRPDQLTWYETIWKGGYPGLLKLPKHLYATFFNSYVQTYIERDIRTVAAVGDLQLFGRFFALLAAMSSCEMNPTQIGRELGIDRKTASHWTAIAEATYQWIEIPPFSRNSIKRASGKYKGYMTDTGLLCYHQRIPEADLIPNHPLQGRLVETWVVMEIVKRIRSWNAQPGVYHYRSHQGAEVDLILEWGGRLFPIEIKCTSTPTRRSGSGMNAFRKTFDGESIAPGMIICAVEEPVWLADNLIAIPWWCL